MATLADRKLTRFSGTRINSGFSKGDYSPEKAGVGGSTPSLATILKPPPNVFYASRIDVHVMCMRAIAGSTYFVYHENRL